MRALAIVVVAASFALMQPQIAKAIVPPRRSISGMRHIQRRPHVTDAFLLNRARVELMAMRFQGTPPLEPGTLTNQRQAMSRPASRSREAQAHITLGQMIAGGTTTAKGAPVIHSRLVGGTVQHSGNVAVAVAHALGSGARIMSTALRQQMAAPQAQSAPVTEVQFIAYGATEEDSTLFTRVYFFVFDPGTGALKTYGNRLATPAEASAAHLPVNPIQ